MGPTGWVSVTVICACGSRWSLCVPVALAVPAPLRCFPGGTPVVQGGSIRHDICCPHCRCSLFGSERLLRDAVESELRRGRGTHVHAGSVVLDCW